MGSNSCPICLEEIVGEIRASPDTCDHVFCLPCLEKWSKLGSYCPVDRKRYKKILNLDSFDTIQVKPRKRKRTSRVLYDISTSCEVCLKDNNAAVLLLCDCCDLGFHMFCLSPPLKAVPAGSWICPTCVAVENKLQDKKGISKEVDVVIKSEIVEASKTNISEECNQVITDYEAISVARSLSSNVFCSNILDDTYSNNVNRIDKIFKATNYETQSHKKNLLKDSKTYNFPNKKKNTSKSLFQEQLHKIQTIKEQSSHVDDMCLKNSLTDDNLIDPYLFEGGTYGYMKPDKPIDDVPESWNFYEGCKQVECTVTNSLHSGTVKESTEISPKGNVNYSLYNDNLPEEYPAIDKSFEVPRNTETVINENAVDVLSPYKFVSESSPKENNVQKTGQYPKLHNYEYKFDLAEAKFAVLKPSNRSFKEYEENIIKRRDKDTLNLNRPATSNVKSKRKFEPEYDASIYGVNIASENSNGDYKFSENSRCSNGFETKSSNNKELISYKDLKFLKFLNDGTFVIDKPKPKMDRPVTNHSQSSTHSNHSSMWDLKHLTILETGTFLYEIPTIKKERSESFQSYNNCTESDIFYRNELQHFTGIFFQ